MKDINKNNVCCLDHISDLIKIDSDVTLLPHYGKVCEKRYNDTFISFFTVNDTSFTHRGVFFDQKLIVESCLLGQYLNLNYIDDGGNICDDYVEETFTQDYSSYQSIFLDEAFYCCLTYDVNYQHFLLESLPKICLASMLSDSIPIVVNDIPFIREILSYLIPEERLIYINPIFDPVIYRCKKSYIIPSVGKNYHDLNNLQVSSLKKLREVVLSASLIGSEVINDIAYNTRLTGQLSGSNRSIANFSQVESLIHKFSIPVFDFGGLTLSEKCSVSSLYKYQITPIGANLMNYIFVTQSLTLFVIDHPFYNNYGHNFFIHVFQSLGLSIDYNILDISEQCEQNKTIDNNVAYLIDCVKLDNFFSDFKSRLPKLT
jgi:hypothetical protein